MTFVRAEAACTWLQNNTAKIAKWYVDINRYDCNEGCGFSYYYNGTSTTDDMILISDRDDYVGGSCDYDTGECYCDETFLLDDCRKSCPGLLGPFTTFQNGSEVQYFEVCSGHGSCDESKTICSCDDGYGGVDKDGYADCHFSYGEFEYDDALVALFSCIFTFIILVLIGSMIWLKMNEKYTV